MKNVFAQADDFPMLDVPEINKKILKVIKFDNNN
jgi:hypothetical protein